MEEIGKLSFSRGDFVGRGRYGTIFQGKLEGTLNVAVKRLEKRLTQVESQSLLKADGHPNIIRYFSTEESDIEFTYLVTELCVGSLVNLVRGDCKEMDIDDGREIIRQITQGIQHLHLLDIIHGDLKPSNIMVTSSKGALKASIKLADFGLRHVAVDLSNNEILVSCPDFRAAFTEDWMAPESYLTTAFDIFALGLVSGFALSRGSHVFGNNRKERMKRIKSQESITLTTAHLINVNNPTVAMQFILSLLRFEPQSRPSATVVLLHPFLADESSSISSVENTEDLRRASSDAPFVKRMKLEELSDEDVAIVLEPEKAEAACYVTPGGLCEPSNDIDCPFQKLQQALSEPLSNVTLHGNNNEENSVSLRQEQKDGKEKKSLNYNPNLDDSIESLETRNQQKPVRIIPSIPASDTTTLVSSNLESRHDFSAVHSEIITKKKVSISRGTDGKLQILGLERGQQLLRTSDGRFVILSPRSKPKGFTASAPHPLRTTEPHHFNPSNSSDTGDKNLLDNLSKANSPPSNQAVKTHRLAIQKPVRMSFPQKNLAVIKEHPISTRRSVENISNTPLALPTSEGTQTIPKIKKPVSSFGFGHKPNQKEKELHQICSRVILEKSDLKRLVELALDPDLNVNCSDSCGRTPLLMLCRNNGSDLVYQFIESLLQRDTVDINFQDREGWGALSLVCHNSRGKQLVEVVKLLIRHGANLDSFNVHGWNAMYCLCRNFRGDVPNKLLILVKILLEEGINIKTKALDGSNVLTALSSNFSHRRHADFFRVLRLLIEFGAEPNAQDSNGRNCLLILCAEYTGSNLIDIVRFLVEKSKINISTKNKNGKKAVDFLLNRGFSEKSEVVQLLL